MLTSASSSANCRVRTLTQNSNCTHYCTQCCRKHTKLHRGVGHFSTKLTKKGLLPFNFHNRILKIAKSYTYQNFTPLTTNIDKISIIFIHNGYKICSMFNHTFILNTRLNLNILDRTQERVLKRNSLVFSIYHIPLLIGSYIANFPLFKAWLWFNQGTPPPPTGRGLRSGFRISKNDKFLSPQMPHLNAKCAMTATTSTILAFTWF